MNGTEFAIILVIVIIVALAIYFYYELTSSTIYMLNSFVKGLNAVPQINITYSGSIHQQLVGKAATYLNNQTPITITYQKYHNSSRFSITISKSISNIPSLGNDKNQTINALNIIGIEINSSTQYLCIKNTQYNCMRVQNALNSFFNYVASNSTYLIPKHLNVNSSNYRANGLACRLNSAEGTIAAINSPFTYYLNGTGTYYISTCTSTAYGVPAIINDSTQFAGGDYSISVVTELNASINYNVNSSQITVLPGPIVNST